MGKTFVYNTGKEETPAGEIWKEFGLFFDGTLNNKDNTELREKVREGKASQAEIEVYNAGSYRKLKDQQGVDNSYANDYTNVARLWKYCERIEYVIYVEGIGTITKDKDNDDGFMFGAGVAGIRQKVRKGCEDLAVKIGNIKKDQNKNSSKKKLTRITLDVFGFSRGAAAARNFLYEVNVKKAYMPQGYLERKTNEDFRKRREETEKKKEKLEMRGVDVGNRKNIPSRQQPYNSGKITDSDGEIISEFFLQDGMLPKMGHLGYMLRTNGFTYEEVEELDLVIRFVGVYDTVSSYYKEKSLTKFVIDQQTGDPAINKYFRDDMGELNLKNVGSVEKAVHFTAKDEHRYNFALSNFPGAVQKKFPGVHCDIGGAYLNEEEIVDEIEVGFIPSENVAKKAIQKGAYLLKKGFWGVDAKINLNDYKNQLIEQSWFKEFQVDINDINTYKYKGKDKVFPTILNSVYYKLSSKRTLRKEYSYIPLLFMGSYYSETLGSKLKTIMPSHSNFISTFSVDGFPVLAKAKEHLEPYVINSIGDPWEFNAEEHFRIKNEILDTKRQRILKNAEEDAKKNKREYKYPASKQDDYMASQNKQKRLKENSENQLLKDEGKEGDIMQNIIEEREIKLKSNQGVLELLRNEYFHWSANKDWFGMNPTESRGRTVIH